MLLIKLEEFRPPQHWQRDVDGSGVVMAYGRTALRPAFTGSVANVTIQIQNRWRVEANGELRQMLGWP